MTTLSPDTPALRAGWDRIFPRAGVLDYAHAGEFADWLEEHDDWRHHLARGVAYCDRTTADGGPFDYDRHTERQAHYVFERRGEYIGVTAAHAVYTVRTPEVEYRIGPVSGTPGRPFAGVCVCTMHPVSGDSITSVWSVLDLAQYDVMRADAARAGVDFPRGAWRA